METAEHQTKRTREKQSRALVLSDDVMVSENKQPRSARVFWPCLSKHPN